MMEQKKAAINNVQRKSDPRRKEREAKEKEAQRKKEEAKRKQQRDDSFSDSDEILEDL